MQVRDEDGVEAPWRGRRRAVATEIPDSGAKYRVGEDAHATQLDEHGGVADVRDASRCYGRDCRPERATSHHPAWVIPGHPSRSQNRAMRGKGRGIGVGALLVIGTLLWTALGFAVWANRQALDTG